LLHKLREAMAEEMRGRVFGGKGRVAKVDGGYFGGYVKPANQKRIPSRPPICPPSKWETEGRP
jgi:hypothetical protein